MPVRAHRLVELDSLRGIAALVVVLHHAYLSLPAVPAWLDAAINASPLRPIATGRQAVVFFFVLSGFVLVRALATQEARQPGSVVSVGGWAQYAAQRAVRLGLPVLAVVVVSAALQWLVWRAPLPPTGGGIVNAGWNAMWTWPQLWQQALLLETGSGFQLDPVLWSLVHEWRIALLLPFALLFRGRLALLLSVALLGAGIARLAGMAEGDNMLGDTMLESLAASAGFLPAFAAGAALALAAPPPLLRAQRLAAGIAVAMLAMVASDYGIVAASVLLIWLAQQGGGFAIRLRHPALLWLGRVSFSLYLVHWPVLMATSHLGQGRLRAEAIAALAVLLSLPAAALLHRLAEAPAHRLAQGLRGAGGGQRVLALR